MIDGKQIKAIAFDLDGTLIDSVPDLYVATQATLDELGLGQCNETQVRAWVGNGAQKLIERALTFAKERAVDGDELQAAMPLFMKHYQANLQQHSQLYEGVKLALEQLSQAGYQLAVVTNKPYRFTIPLLKAFGIDHHFSEILGGDSLEKMKPDPLPLTHLLDKWQLSAEQLLMVGDSKNDIFAAQAAGICSIGLTYGYNYGEDIGLSGPSAVCEHFSEVVAHIIDRPQVLEQ
ncbi:phosphoglycolate phosphatase [Shewanella sp. Isolate11]|uniref:phosphoglycolate phosphatase n=1 Tax=Shewanella sp. Isolate11 TaxID=2908530 RepID=UPI001EFE72B7|nr:phosphoglycolate phosphatase [Shewanella sp. Isolate11]MCG9695361.1 phosphoglycolate phosphatase [Shewanella sp. Isolate11]